MVGQGSTSRSALADAARGVRFDRESEPQPGSTEVDGRLTTPSSTADTSIRRRHAAAKPTQETECTVTYGR